MKIQKKRTKKKEIELTNNRYVRNIIDKEHTDTYTHIHIVKNLIDTTSFNVQKQ